MVLKRLAQIYVFCVFILSYSQLQGATYKVGTSASRVFRHGIVVFQVTKKFPRMAFPPNMTTFQGLSAHFRCDDTVLCGYFSFHGSHQQLQRRDPMLCRIVSFAALLLNLRRKFSETHKRKAGDVGNTRLGCETRRCFWQRGGFLSCAG